MRAYSVTTSSTEKPVGSHYWTDGHCSRSRSAVNYHVMDDITQTTYCTSFVYIVSLCVAADAAYAIIIISLLRTKAAIQVIKTYKNVKLSKQTNIQ